MQLRKHTHGSGSETRASRAAAAGQADAGQDSLWMRACGGTPSAAWCLKERKKERTGGSMVRAALAPRCRRASARLHLSQPPACQSGQHAGAGCRQLGEVLVGGAPVAGEILACRGRGRQAFETRNVAGCRRLLRLSGQAGHKHMSPMSLIALALSAQSLMHGARLLAGDQRGALAPRSQLGHGGAQPARE